MVLLLNVFCAGFSFQYLWCWTLVVGQNAPICGLWDLHVVGWINIHIIYYSILHFQQHLIVHFKVFRSWQTRVHGLARLIFITSVLQFNLPCLFVIFWMFQEDTKMLIEHGEELDCNPQIRIRQWIRMVFQELKSIRTTWINISHSILPCTVIWDFELASCSPIQRIFVWMVSSSLSNG